MTKSLREYLTEAAWWYLDVKYDASDRIVGWDNPLSTKIKAVDFTGQTRQSGDRKECKVWVKEPLTKDEYRCIGNELYCLPITFIHESTETILKETELSPFRKWQLQKVRNILGFE